MKHLALILLFLAVGLQGCDGTGPRAAAGGAAPPATDADTAPPPATPPGGSGAPDTPGTPDPGGDGDGSADDDGTPDGPGAPVDPTEPPPDDSTPGDSGSLRDCFNPLLATIGTRTELAYRTTSAAGSIGFSSDLLVTRETAFNGNTVIESVADTSSSGGPAGSDSENRSTVLYTIDASAARSRTFRTSVEAQTVAGTITTESTFDPFWQTDFGLSPGDSATTDYTVRTAISGLPVPLPPTEATISRTRTYIGRETITVPAGSFSTCLVEETVFSTVGGTTSEEANVYWFGVGSGVVIREIGAAADGSESTTTELVSGSINGAPL